MLGIVDTVAGVVDNVLDKFIEDKDLKTKLNHELKKSVQDANLAQIQANIEQAKHASIFVAGARPAIMWVCCFGLAWQFVLQPIAVWVINVTENDIPLPLIPTEGLLPLTLALLGLGGMRTAEKWKGKARNNMKN
jgi:hypothetical protein|tara:strand:- start:1597 stop:2001 length:405 start_codon:yes stop_codon:yes gene_type:complete